MVSPPPYFPPLDLDRTVEAAQDAQHFDAAAPGGAQFDPTRVHSTRPQPHRLDGVPQASEQPKGTESSRSDAR